MYQRDDLSGVLGELVGELFVVGDKVGDIDVAVVLLYEHIFADLISAEMSAILIMYPGLRRTYI